MIIDIDRLPDEGLQVCDDFEFLSVDLVDENAVFLEPVTAEIFVRRIGEQVFIKGRIAARLSFVCGRCLSPFEFPIDSRFDLVYLPEDLDVSKEHLDNEDLDQFFYADRQIDLDEVVLEQLNLTFPLKPLCDKGCPGICPVCGRVIKDGECTCETNEADPRLLRLKNFLRDKR